MLSAHRFKHISVASCLAVLLTTSLATTSLAAQADPVSVAGLNGKGDPSVSAVPHAEVLALSDSFKQTLDLQVAPVTHPAKRAQALHELLFSKQGYQVPLHTHSHGYTRLRQR